MKKRILLLFLSAVMMLSNLATPIYAAANDDKREVYLHAQDNPDRTAPSGGEAFLGQDVNVYLAVDAPNKGDTKLNGYFVRFYYDSKYLKLKNETEPLNYFLDEKDYMVAPTAEGGKSEGISFSGPNISGIETIDGINYNVITALVLFSGIEFPHAENASWTNILGITFEAINEGVTEVFIDTMSFDEADRGFQLFSKHTAEGKKYFTASIRNGGRYLLDINGISTPEKPKINKPGGAYGPTELPSNSIEITADTGCEIWYTTDENAPNYLSLDEHGNDKFYKKVNSNFFVYDKPIEKTTTLKAIATRTSNDGETVKASTATVVTYTIVPTSPSLFLVDNIENGVVTAAHRIGETLYEAYSPFNITFDDENIYDGVLNENYDIWYTFSNLDSNKIFDYNIINYQAGDPKTDWIWFNYTNSQNQDWQKPIWIDEDCRVRIVMRRKDAISDVTEYYLRITPAPALVKEESQEPNTAHQQNVDVELISQTEGATIYYTLNGSDPRLSDNVRHIYNGVPIPISKSTVLRTVAYYNGKYSELKTYRYIFPHTGSLWVESSHPSGDYYDEVEVHLISANIDDEIYYTTDGTNPENSSTRLKYDRTKPFIIKDDMSISAVAKDVNGAYSDMVEFNYWIKPKTPVFIPETTQFSEHGEVFIYTNYNYTDGYELWISTDGTDPREDSGNTIKVTDANEYKFTGENEITEYTVVSAAILKRSGSKMTFSDLVINSYDIVHSRPAKPVTTLTPGEYYVEVGESSDYETSFVPPGDGITIYCTWATKSEATPRLRVSNLQDGFYPPEDPIGSEDEWKWVDEHGNVNVIPIKGETIVKAIAVDSLGRRSDIAIFHFTIIPEAPVAPPSAIVRSIEFIPVKVVEGCSVSYVINGHTKTITANSLSGLTEFYICANTGAAYTERSLTSTKLCEDEPGDISGQNITLIKYSTLDGVNSDTVEYNYYLTPDADPNPPIFNPQQGSYGQQRQSSTDPYIVVKLDKLESAGEIQWKFAEEDTWEVYNESNGIPLYDDGEIWARTKIDDDYSDVIYAEYTFEPLPPVISPQSGKHEEGTKIKISFNRDASPPNNSTYVIRYELNGVLQNEKIFYNPSNPIPKEILLTDNTDIRAWIEEIDAWDRTTIKDKSTTVIRNYSLVSPTTETGTVFFGKPFDEKNRFSSYEIDNLWKNYGTYGIKLISNPLLKTICYNYNYQTQNGEWYPAEDIMYSQDFIYNNIPIGVHSQMKQITVKAWINGFESQSAVTKTFYIVDLGTPNATPAVGMYTSAQTVKLVNEHDKTTYPNRYIEYKVGNSSSYSAYTDETDNIGISISASEKIYARYVESCGKDVCAECKSGRYEGCADKIYGQPKDFDYYITKSTGGGGGGGGGSSGGGGSTTTKKKYTIDHFGNEHPHHTNYLYGYPDGTVQGDGNITREETAAILYRVYHKEYEEPNPAQGDMYPDVTADMWSAASIEYLSDVGLIMGYPDGTYLPRNQITRAEFVAMITRWLKLDTNVKLTNKDTKFSDLEESHWAYNEIYALSKIGYIKGYEDGTFRPQQPITRAEAVTIINRILGRKPDRSYLQKSDFNPYTDLHGDEWYYEQVLEATINHYYDLKDTENPWHLQIND